MIYQVRRRLLLRWTFLLAFIFTSTIFILKIITKDEVTEHCRPRQNVVFIKTHKCASSTIQNVLLRFGEAHNLTFVLPKKGNYIGYPQRFERGMVLGGDAYNLTYNILTHHTRFHYREMSLLMPEDTVYVTIVRHPVEQFESMLYYYNLARFIPELPNSSFSVDSLVRLITGPRLLGKIGVNQMSFDLGLDPSDFDRPAIVRRFLSFLDKTMDLVMVTEQMDQSLVLLADLLCWKLDDVIALRLNARQSNYKTRAALPSSLLLRLNAADATLYEHFTQRFRERVREFGDERMRQRTEELKRLTREKMVECGVNSHNGSRDLKAMKKVVYYSVENGGEWDCKRLVEQELVYTNILIKKQQLMFPKRTIRMAWLALQRRRNRTLKLPMYRKTSLIGARGD